MIFYLFQMFNVKKQEKKRQPKFSKIHISKTKAYLYKEVVIHV